MTPWDNYSISELPEIASSLIREAKDYPNVWLFRGEMGAGKTTLIKEICHQLGVAQSVQSPTFSLVNEYVDGKGKPIYHFDLYRLKNAQEAFDIGLEEYLDSGNLCLIEWPEQAEEFWTFEHVELNVAHIDDTHRKLEVVWRRY
jgi:tRNA threonylcarbamoyladenosine biosynthesis protein TsaE